MPGSFYYFDLQKIRTYQLKIIKRAGPRHKIKRIHVWGRRVHNHAHPPPVRHSIGNIPRGVVLSSSFLVERNRIIVSEQLLYSLFNTRVPNNRDHVSFRAVAVYMEYLPPPTSPAQTKYKLRCNTDRLRVFFLLIEFVYSSPPIRPRPAHGWFSDGSTPIESVSTIVPFDLYLFIHYTKTLSLTFRYDSQYTSRPHPNT